MGRWLRKSTVGEREGRARPGGAPWRRFSRRRETLTGVGKLLNGVAGFAHHLVFLGAQRKDERLEVGNGQRDGLELRPGRGQCVRVCA